MNEKKLYVGNLSYEATDGDLNELFGQYGSIEEVKLITDRDTGRSKGFAFVTFENEQSAQDALEVNDTEFQGRKLRVNIARPKTDSGRSGGGFRGGDRPQRW